LLKISNAGCLGLSPVRRNSLLKCALQPKNAKNVPKIFLFWVQGHSGSSILTFRVIDIDKTKKPMSHLLVVISNLSVPIYNRFHNRRANSGKATFFLWGTSLWCPHSRGTPLPRGVKFYHEKWILEAASPHWRFCDPNLHRFDSAQRCDGQTDGLSSVTSNGDAVACTNCVVRAHNVRMLN